MRYRPDLTQELLKQFVHYDPHTGILMRTHALNRGHKLIRKEFVPQSITAQGYRQLSLFKYPRLVHRLVFLYMTGKEALEVDHVNGDRLDNRWCNLREVTSSENSRNMGLSKDNKSGVSGVYFYPRYQKWEVTITRGGVHEYLGRYCDWSEAVTIRKKAEQDLDFHPNHGARPSWRG